MINAENAISNTWTAPNYQVKFDSLPINHQDFWMIESKGINYYMVDLRGNHINTVIDIINECAAVEKKCWKAQEDFYDYIQKCDILSYAVLDNRIIGFCAGSRFDHGAICMYCNDETMVLKDFRNRKIARNLVFASMRWGLKNHSFEGIKHFVFMSISCNPRIVNAYYKHSFLIKILFECSFNASAGLVELLDTYRKKYNIPLVNKDYPFCLKNMFPGSNNFNPAEKRFQFSDGVKRYMPVDFDPMKRGDAFAFMVKVPTYFTRAFVIILMVISFGKQFFSRRGIGLFTRNAC